MRLLRAALFVALSVAPLGAFDSPAPGPSAPVAIFKAEPEYTQAARDAKLEGEVWLSVMIDEKGVPAEFVVKRSLGLGLDEKAIEAAKKWRFKPGLKFGVAVPVQATIAVSFHLLKR